MEDARTLKEWRELRGLSRAELAEATFLEEDLIARIEEVGIPTRASMRKDDDFTDEVLGSIMEALDLEEDIYFNDAPIESSPGDIVFDPSKLADLDPGIAEFLQSHAEELNLRVAVPNQWDVALKPYADIQREDIKAIGEWCREEAAYAAEMGRQAMNMAALMEEHSADPNAKTGDVLEFRNGGWVPKSREDDEEK